MATPLHGALPERYDPRCISRLTRATVALVLAGGQGTRLHELTAWRAKPAVPFGGKFRLVDFPLSKDSWSSAKVATTGALYVCGPAQETSLHRSRTSSW